MRPVVALSKRVSSAHCAILNVIFGRIFLTKSGKRRKPPTSGGDGGPRDNDPAEDDGPAQDGGPDEAAAFIAQTVAELARMARRHELGVLVRLLEMTQMEAEERLRLRGKHKLS